MRVVSLVYYLHCGCCCWYLLTASSRQVSAPVVTSQCINLQHVDWNHRGIDTYCRIQNCSCNNSSDCLHKYVVHHYIVKIRWKWNQIFLLAERMNWKNANLISLSILFVMQSDCAGARRRLSESCKWPLHFAEAQISNNILQLVPDFIVMQTSQQEVTYSFTFLITVTHWRFP